MRSPEIMDAAETMTNVAFVGKVVKDHPELHFERKIKLVFRPTASAYAVEMRALDLVGRLLSINDREGQFEALAADFLGEHDEATQADQSGILRSVESGLECRASADIVRLYGLN